MERGNKRKNQGKGSRQPDAWKDAILLQHGEATEELQVSYLRPKQKLICHKPKMETAIRRMVEVLF